MHNYNEQILRYQQPSSERKNVIRMREFWPRVRLQVGKYDGNLVERLSNQKKLRILYALPIFLVSNNM